jgi:heme exporter protein C
MATEILVPLLLMTIAFTLLFVLLHLVSMRTEVLKRRAESLSRQQALKAVAK